MVNNIFEEYCLVRLMICYKGKLKHKWLNSREVWLLNIDNSWIYGGFKEACLWAVDVFAHLLEHLDKCCWNGWDDGFVGHQQIALCPHHV